jgi:hypothetical protein
MTTFEREMQSDEIRGLDIPTAVVNKIRELCNKLDRSITWSVEDFAERARQLKGKNWRRYYDEDKFDEVLLTMIHDHDCNNGITWDTIDAYLDYQCRK